MEVFGRDYIKTMNSIRSLTDSTWLEIVWREGEAGWKVSIDGLNRKLRKRVYHITGVAETPEQEILIKNTRNAIVIGRRWYDEPETPAIPINGLATEWIGGFQAPWLVRPLARRIKQAVGLDIPIDRLVWAASQKLWGWHWRQPVFALAGPNGKPLNIPLPDDEEPAWSRLGTVDSRTAHRVSFWPVDPELLDDRIPVWEKGWLGTLRRCKESPNEAEPTHLIGGYLRRWWKCAFARLPRLSYDEIKGLELRFREDVRESTEDVVVLPDIGERVWLITVDV